MGAGLGANTAALQNPEVHSWLCLEPDPGLSGRLKEATKNLETCTVVTGTIGDLSGRLFDSILYIDVLEHIKSDREELEQAARLLRTGGHLIVLSPAHQYLFSAFDAAIGHHRRYNRRSLSLCLPSGCRLESMVYLDSSGMLASLANRLFLRESNPSVAQIEFWDSYLIPFSRVLDEVFGHRIGKTIVGVWTRMA